ncbi:MAG TPA: Gfo/Idh/MocA family oxidoreductase [Anaerolineae bacterium]|nr:Gfo/Idh/MocA family oxidoreductase [Anaerolineae bacterium]
MKPIRVGVIGVGMMGERHGRVYSNLRDTELIGVFDNNPGRGRAVADRYETRYFESPTALLGEVDAVTIATPTPYHFELAMQALAAGVHTLVEKPLAYTLDEAEKLVAAARSSGLVVQVGHIERFNPAYIELKNVADDLPLVAITIRRQNSYDASNKDVDVINDLMIHDIDLLLDLVGQPVEGVTACGRSLVGGAIDHAVANFSFRDGPIATLIASRITQDKVRTFDLTARNAYVEGDLLSKSIAVHRRVFSEFISAKYRQESVIERLHIPVAEPLLLELQHFIGCIQDQRQPDVSVEHGLRAMKYAAQIAESVRSMNQPYAGSLVNPLAKNGETNLSV